MDSGFLPGFLLYLRVTSGASFERDVTGTQSAAANLLCPSPHQINYTPRF